MMTVAEVAEHLKVDKQTVYQWIWSGHLPSRRLGPKRRTIRIDEDDLARFLEEAAA